MSEEIIDVDDPNKNGERPTFLTVLCILSFIGSGLGILGELMGNIVKSSHAGGSMLTSLSFISTILCLFGAILMWQLKKIGFTLYVIGSSIYVANTIFLAVLYSTISSSLYTEGPLSFFYYWGSVIFGILITVAFVIMYASNRKSLIH